MLYNLILDFLDQYTFLNVFKYLTFRTGLAMLTSMVVVLLIGTPFINFFSSRKILDPIREDGPTEHIVKKIGTPTMGGILILIGLFSGVLLWGDLSSIYIWFSRRNPNKWIILKRTCLLCCKLYINSSSFHPSF